MNMWKTFWFDINGNPKLKDILHNPIFWVVALLKVFCGAFLASNYFSDLFFPFFEYFSSHPLQNPYEIFWQSGNTRAFPYPAVMLYSMVALRFLLIPFGIENWPVLAKFFIYHIPLFIADFAILAVFVRWLYGRTNRIIVLLWSSPVLFYISYVHGQLDILPIAFLTISLHFLFKDRLHASAIFLGLGCACKTHLLLIAPFFLVYIWRKNEKTKDLFNYFSISIAAFLIPNLPFIFSPAFQHMVFLNAEQQKIGLASLKLLSNGPDFYLIPASYMLLLFYALCIKLQNRDVFLMFLGFTFGILLLFIPPMQGWYFWVIPFLVYFFARASLPQSLLFVFLQLSYFLYFSLGASSDYRQVLHLVFPEFSAGPNLYTFLSNRNFNAPLFENVAFTAMQTLLIANCAWIYWRGIKGLQYNKLSSHAFLIGIAGDSGSGKSTLTKNLEQLFTPLYMAALCGDDMHKWQRGHAKWQEYTHLNPKGNELHKEMHYIAAMRQHVTIYRRHYDHNTGKFTDAIAIPPKPLMVMEGLHTFFLKPAREMLDLKIFMRPDDNLLLHWKIQRDIVKRGYSKEQVIASVAARQADAENYVKVQANTADIVFSFLPLVPFGDNLGELNYTPEVSLRVMLANRFYLDPMLDDISELYPDTVKHYYSGDNWQVIEFDHPITLDEIEQIGEKHVSGLQDFGLYAPAWCGGWEGLLQLIVAYTIFHDSTRFPEF